jgi:hypothetical protein
MIGGLGSSQTTRLMKDFRVYQSRTNPGRALRIVESGRLRIASGNNGVPFQSNCPDAHDTGQKS